MKSFITPSSWLSQPVNIMVIGAGGTGSALLSYLAQMDHSLRQLSDGQSYLNLSVVDGDEISVFNIGRQAFAQNDIGHYKSEVLVQRFNQFYGTKWSYSTDYITPKDIARSYGIDLVISCVDSAKFRYELGKYFTFQHTETLWLDCGNDANSAQVLFGHLGICKAELRLPNIFDLYGAELKSIEDRPEDSCSFHESLTNQEFGINHSTALQASNMLWQLMRHGQLDYMGSYVDLPTGQVTPLAIDEDVWASFGYQSKAA